MTGSHTMQCIMGPVGSGKSVASCLRALTVGQRQEPSPPDPVSGRRLRRTRGCIVRNTMPELRATTIETYQRVYPEEGTGPVIYRSPAEHRIIRGDLDIQVLFIALDRPADIKKLLSLELTWAWLNEGRELPRAVLNRMLERLGRYRIEERPTTWSGLWMDTNAPDSDHYLWAIDQNPPPDWKVYHQPPAVLEVTRGADGRAVVTDENFPGIQGQEWRSCTVGGQEFETEMIEAAERLWIVNPLAENLEPLWRVNRAASPVGARSYYGRSLAGKSIDEIRSYLQGVYAYVAEGRRVVPNYHPPTHGRQHIEALPDEPLVLMCDIGGGTLQPSCIVAQKHPRGPVLALSEVVCFEMGVHRFGELIMEHLQRRYPAHVERGAFRRLIGDPAGVGRDEIFEVAAFDHLRHEFGFETEAAPTQDIAYRYQAIIRACGRLIDGVPGLLVSTSGCPMLHKGLSGAWIFKRLKVAGEDRFSDKPLKNDYSHPCDAMGYGLLGLGEYDALAGRSEFLPGAVTADTGTPSDWMPT
jgi:hypothetical protein